jgi:UDP-N-acetylmuramate dehydrogenase
MEIQTNFSLKNYNTFGIEAKAKQFVCCTAESDQRFRTKQISD